MVSSTESRSIENSARSRRPSASSVIAPAPSWASNSPSSGASSRALIAYEASWAGEAGRSRYSFRAASGMEIADRATSTTTAFFPLK